jgi:hypothetical protein
VEPIATARYGLLRLCYACPENVMSKIAKDFEDFDPKTAISAGMADSSVSL